MQLIGYPVHITCGFIANQRLFASSFCTTTSLQELFCALMGKAVKDNYEVYLVPIIRGYLIVRGVLHRISGQLLPENIN